MEGQIGIRVGWVALALGLVLAGCAGRKPHGVPAVRETSVVHQVAAGETLYRIGLAYGVPYERIARANGLEDPSRIFVGQRLLIPGGQPKRGRPATVASNRRQRPVRDPAAPRLKWPVAGGTVTSGFGSRNGAAHDGIDIAAPAGTAVQAAADGEVAYAGTLPGYGNVVILRHAAGYATVYAHNERNRVSEGQSVRQGQLIATVGRSGRTTGPNLHFEVRANKAAEDPLLFLPVKLQVGEKATHGQPGG